MSLTAYRQAGKTEIQSVDPDHPLPVTIAVGGIAAGTSANPLVEVEQGLGTLATNQVSVASTSTSIVAARASRGAVVIMNRSSVSVFVGVTGVTTSTGLEVPAGWSVTLETTAAVFGIVATGTATVSYAEVF